MPARVVVAAWLLLVAGCPMLMLWLGVYQPMAERLRHDALGRLEADARDVAIAVAGAQRQIAMAAAGAAREPAVVTLIGRPDDADLRAEARGQLAARLDASAGVLAFTLLDADGRVLASVGAERSGWDERSPPLAGASGLVVGAEGTPADGWVGLPRKDTLHAGPFRQDRWLHTPKPVTLGRLRGLLIASTCSRRIMAGAAMSVPQAGVTLWSAEGVPLGVDGSMVPELPRWMAEVSGAGDGREAGQPGPSAQAFLVATRLSGPDWTRVFVPFRQAAGARPWVVDVSVPTAAVAPDAEMLISGSLVKSGVVAALAVAGAFIGSALLARSARRLADLAARVHRGDLSPRAPHFSSLEMHQLGQSLNAMLDRLQAQESQLRGELAHRREALEAIFAFAPMGLFQSDAEGRLITMSPAAQALIGAARGEDPADAGAAHADPDARSVDSSGSPADRREANASAIAQVMDALRAAAADAAPIDQRLDIVAAGSAVARHARLIAAPVFAGGVFVGHVGGVLDVTEQVRAEAAEREARRRLDLGEELGAFGHWAFDVATQKIEWSTGVFRVFRRDPEHGPPGFDENMAYYPPTDRARLREAVARAIDLGEPFALDQRVIVADGSKRWHFGRGWAVRDASGKVARLFGVVQDITERKEAQERFERVARGSTDGVWDWNLETNEVYYSPSYRRLLGYSHEQFPDHLDAFQRLLHPDDRQTVWDAVTAHLEHDAEYDVEYRLRDAQGHWRWFRARGQCVRDESGRPTRFTGSHSDITARRLAEEAAREHARQLEHAHAELARKGQALRRQTELAQAATAAKSAFLANMSHEIRSPMTAILGYAELLGDPGLPEHDRGEYSGIIRRNGEHLLAILNDILDLSKIEAGRMTIESVEASPARLITDVAALLRERAAGKGIELVCDIDPSTPHRVRTDPVRLRQVLLNLAGNAVKFTEAGRVQIRLRAQPAEDDRAQLHFAVVDTGEGLAPDQLTRIFQPFTQADASTTRRFGGTGLGLSISRRLVELLGGTLSATSTPGAGSTFEFSIVVPVARAAAIDERNEDAANDPPESLPSPILLADDGPDNRRLLGHLLRRAGAQVELAEHGRHALDLCEAAIARGRPFELIILDMQMPVMDGYETAHTLRHRGHATPILALTAHALPAERTRCLEAGCTGFATKPIDRDNLIAACLAMRQAVYDLSAGRPRLPSSDDRDQFDDPSQSASV